MGCLWQWDTQKITRKVVWRSPKGPKVWWNYWFFRLSWTLVKLTSLFEIKLRKSTIFAIILTPDAKFVKSFLILAKYVDENFCIKFFAFVKSFSRLYKVFVSKVFELPCRTGSFISKGQVHFSLLSSLILATLGFSLFDFVKHFLRNFSLMFL